MRLLWIVLLACALALPAACPRERQPLLTPRRDELPRSPPRERIRIALVGDTGKPGARATAVARAIRAEPKDLVVALGDLVYPIGPKCPTGHAEGRALRVLEERFAAPLVDLGAPVLVVLGNHDVGHHRRHRAREACFLDYAARHERLVFPALSYTVDLGVAVVAVLNTNALTDADGERVRRELDAHRGWRIVIGHHVLKTYHDKENEDYVRPWLRRHGIRPDLYANGHAHFLQFGVYDGVPALTSGSGSKVRAHPPCPPRCGAGQLFGRSVGGYAMLELAPGVMDVTFKDREGRTLWRWSKRR